MNHRTHAAGSTVSSASSRNSHALPSSHPPGVRSLMPTSPDESVSPRPAFQSDSTYRLLPVCYRTKRSSVRIVLWPSLLRRILESHCFPEYWFSANPPRGSPHQSPVEIWAPMFASRFLGISAACVVVASCTASAEYLSS